MASAGWSQKAAQCADCVGAERSGEEISWRAVGTAATGTWGRNSREGSTNPSKRLVRDYGATARWGGDGGDVEGKTASRIISIFLLGLGQANRDLAVATRSQRPSAAAAAAGAGQACFTKQVIYTCTSIQDVLFAALSLARLLFLFCWQRATMACVSLHMLLPRRTPDVNTPVQRPPCHV